MAVKIFIDAVVCDCYSNETVLLLAGNIHNHSNLSNTIEYLARRFAHVVCVAGNIATELAAFAGDGKTIVVTHHLPCYRCIHPKFARSTINAGFVADMDELIEKIERQLKQKHETKPLFTIRWRAV